jgi:hypothetical protein
MTFSQTLITIFEIIMVAAVVWCIFHEDRLVAFEEKLFSRIRRKRLRVVKAEKVRTY